MPDINQAIDAVYNLSVGVIGTGALRHERPHKPALLLAVLDALDAGQAIPAHVDWSDWLRRRFRNYFEIVQSANDDCTPENPFIYLKSDGFWLPWKISGSTRVQLAGPPSAGDAESGVVFAEFSEKWADLLNLPRNRDLLREALVARYFPKHARLITALLNRPLLPADDPTELSARSTAFRRKLLEIYDHQCCACGLRIRLPEVGVTFVDAAHLIPFADTRNDHPTNGICLCKNHHWAMDMNLIAPDPDSVWHVSPRLDARRSAGEEQLVALSGKKLMQPLEPAYAPASDSLDWRFQRLNLVVCTQIGMPT